MSRWVSVVFGLSFLSAAWSQDPPSTEAAHPLFNGKDLQGWLADPLAIDHWKVKEGVLHADGKGHNLISEENYRDFELTVEWRAAAGSHGGVWIRSRPKIAIENPAMNDDGSGGLVNNKEKPAKPAAKADKPAGEWNTFQIQVSGNVVTVQLNDQVVVDKAVMENAFDSSRKLPVTGKIELEATGPIEFRKIEIKPIDAAAQQ